MLHAYYNFHNLASVKGKGRPKLKDIDNHVVVRWAPQWRQLGRQLNIEEHQMNTIECDHPNNCVECCSKMLSDWLEQNTSEHTTWEILICAIDKLPEDLTGNFYIAHAIYFHI